jgi:NADPH:quinone reductase-like Zn-dependent oxidoreductase
MNSRPDDTTMKAIRYDRYGSLDELYLTDVAVPEPGEDQVRVRVHAAGVHIGDTFAVHGTPLPVRAMSGLFKPKIGIGFDFAGVIEAVGKNVSQLRVGDRVFGCGTGTAAEQVVASAEHVLPIPGELDLEMAAALPTSAMAALRAVRDVAHIEAGQHMLINGASGGVGTYAVQIAKAYGAEVTGVSSTRNLELVRSLGADHVIDYTCEDFTAEEGRYDVILDNVENRPLEEVRRALTKDGTLILNSGTGASGLRMYTRLLAPLVMNPFTSQNLKRFISEPNKRDLEEIAELVKSGKIRPIIDRSYELAETAEALRYIEDGHARGKVVVTVAESQP